MSRYDGLIIPRSYNDYFSRSDPQAIQRVVKMATDETLNINSENPIQNKAVAKLVPATASETNQLADKNFVNSTVGTNTANYIYKTVEGENVPFDSVAELEAYTGTVTQNDYAFVTGIDDDGNRYYDRYKANETEGVITWGKEYRLNNSSFTAEQWAAIESGITAEKIAAYDAGITPPVDYVEAEEMAPVTSNAVANELETNYYNKQTVDLKIKGMQTSSESKTTRTVSVGIGGIVTLRSITIPAHTLFFTESWRNTAFETNGNPCAVFYSLSESNLDSSDVFAISEIVKSANYQFHSITGFYSNNSDVSITVYQRVFSGSYNLNNITYKYRDTFLQFL